MNLQPRGGAHDHLRAELEHDIQFEPEAMFSSNDVWFPIVSVLVKLVRIEGGGLEADIRRGGSGGFSAPRRPGLLLLRPAQLLEPIGVRSHGRADAKHSTFTFHFDIITSHHPHNCSCH